MDNVPKKRDSHQVVIEDDIETTKKARPTTQTAVASTDAAAAATTLGSAVSRVCKSSSKKIESTQEALLTKSEVPSAVAFAADEAASCGDTDEGYESKRRACLEDFEYYSSLLEVGKNNWDLESALHRITQIGDASDDPKEMLSSHVWVKFRVGHSGDAFTLASFYQKSLDRCRNKNTSMNLLESQKASRAGGIDVEDFSSFEVRLADSLGDEDNPPFVFALVAELFSDDTSPFSNTIGATAFLTLAWQVRTSSFVIQIEWLYVDRSSPELIDVADVLERRLWLRLSTVSLMTSYELILNNDDVRLKSPQITR